VEAVATGDEVARDLVRLAVLHVAHAGAGPVEIDRQDIAGLVDRLQSGGGARVHQVARQLGLAVDHHRLAHEIDEVDALPVAVETELDAMMHQPLGMHPRADADAVHQFDRAPFEHTRADTSKHILGALPL
jgi:hypothetical protein